MCSINETNNIRNSLKMRLSQYSWYLGSSIIPNIEGYGIQVDVSRISSDILNLVPFKLKGVRVKVQLKLEGQDE